MLVVRFAPSLPLPPYTYVPGQTPHPVSDPQGHGFGTASLDGGPLELDRWMACSNYCFAIDLFNHGYYWEAHEVWERLWHRAGRQGTTADFLKGLIKLAAALVKVRERRSAGVSRHAARAAELFRLVRDARRDTDVPDRMAGLSLRDLESLASQVQQQADRLVSSQLSVDRNSPDRPQKLFTQCQLMPQVEQ
jgi:predicted metal-dependent hydrolase